MAYSLWHISYGKSQGLLQARVDEEDFSLLQNLCLLYWQAGELSALSEVAAAIKKTS